MLHARAGLDQARPYDVEFSFTLMLRFVSCRVRSDESIFLAPHPAEPGQGVQFSPSYTDTCGILGGGGTGPSTARQLIIPRGIIKNDNTDVLIAALMVRFLW